MTTNVKLTAMTAAADTFRKATANTRYLARPVDWVVERMGEHAWSKQVEVMNALVDHRRVAVKSAHGTGKSHLASRAAAHWLDTHPVGEAFVVTTAPTASQVRAVLWRYIGQAHRKANLPGRVTQIEWWIGPELVGFGRKPSDYSESAFQGIHARYVLVIIDEACGIPEQLWIAADALTTNPDCRILAIGNPDDPSSHFRKVCDSKLWHTIRISAYDSPNFTEEEVPEALAAQLISKSWAEEKATEWGIESPIYIAKVLGEFPPEDPDSVVRLTDVMRCRMVPDTPRTSREQLPVELGVDIGAGGDETVIRERRGVVAGREWRSRDRNPERVTQLIHQAVIETGATAVKIDSIGIGWGIVGSVRTSLGHASSGTRVVAVNVGQSPTDRDRYINLRAELWWTVGRLLSQNNGWDLSQMENADTTISQLVTPKWFASDGGKIKVEPKADVIDRLGRSPDNADALLLAFYQGGSAASAFLEMLVR